MEANQDGGMVWFICKKFRFRQRDIKSETARKFVIPCASGVTYISTLKNILTDILINIHSQRSTMIKRIAVFLYGTVSYAVFFGTILYAIGFVGNVIVPKSIDSEPSVPFALALLTNVAFLAIFAVQHSVMARRGFKRWVTRFIPEPAERSTYVLLASLALILLFTQWQPIGGMVWNVSSPGARGVLYALFGFGWALVFAATFLINHFDLFGLRQVWAYLRDSEYRPLKFRTPGPYRLVRHPLYLGFLFAFWAAPTMTVTHLFFAIATTVYILIAIQLEERDLVAEHGTTYTQYRDRVPMILPFSKGSQLGEETMYN
jgi:methanethiol S-methyltransferase